MSGKTRKLSEAQIVKLRTVPDDWATVPIFGDTRPIHPLLRAGMIETRHIDCTPKDWGSGPVKVVRHEWRITNQGRLALQEQP